MSGVFSPEEVVALNDYQRGEGKWAEPFARMHPFTCPNRGDGNHRENGIDLGGLVPTVRGWVCQFCDYQQDWAHGFMSKPDVGEMVGNGLMIKGGKGE